MRVKYTDFPICNSAGIAIGKLDGEYEASANDGQQPGWHALRKVKDDGTIDEEIVANIHILGVQTT